MPPRARRTTKSQEVAAGGAVTARKRETRVMDIFSFVLHVFEIILKAASSTKAKAAAMRPMAWSVMAAMRGAESVWRWA